MRIQTRDLGVVTVAPDEVLTFVEPILGFEANRRFVLLRAPQAEPFRWLQSLDNKELVFPVIPAEELPMSYEVDEQKLASLGAEGPDSLSAWIIVKFPRDGAGIQLNLRAPVVINRHNRLACQIVLSDEWPTNHHMAVEAAAEVRVG